MLALIGSLIVSLLCTSAHASPDHQDRTNESSVFIESPVNQFLGEALYTFPDGDKTWQELSSLPITHGVQNKADFYNADAFKLPIWVRTDLTTGQIDPNDLWLMGLGSGFAGDVELYLVTDGKLISHQKNSPYETFDSREFDYRLLHFALDLPSHSNVQLLLKINFSPIPHYKPTIVTEELMTGEEIYWMAWVGFGLGFLVAIGLFHLTLASATYDKVYVYYFLYVLGSGLWFIETHGLLFKYIWPNNPEFMLYFSGFMYYSPIIFAYFFVVTFLQLPKISKKLTNYFYSLAALLVLTIVGKVFVPGISLNLIGLIVMISSLSFIYAGFYARRKGVYYAKYYIVAWTLYCLSILNMMLYVGGAPSFMPNYTYWVLVIVFDIQVMLLAFALAHRIRIIRQSKIEAEADNRAQSEFLARMSHEIRTPINGVLGMAELMVDRLKDETDIYYMNIIRSSGSSLLTIINDILDYSKFTSGKMELENIPFNLQRLAVESFDIFKIKAAEKNIELITDIDFDLPEAVLGDPTRIKQIMLNFISNAIKFTDEGQVVLKVYRETESDRIKISVVDSGEGISKSGQEKLFNAFSQASTSTSRKHGGTGLGLSICKQLTLMMGGEIGLDSEVGKGSTFWISVNLPMSTDFIQEDKIEDVSLEGYNLLIVEDNYTFAELLFNQASLWGMKCQVATNGKEALALLRQNYQVGIQFDLISLDLIMPKMDGIETSKHIFADERFRDIPMLLLTSATNFPSKTALASSGIMRVIEKPTLPADIKRTYKELLIKQEEADSVPALSSSEDEIALPSLSILVAEDNKVNQLVMKGILKRLKQSAVIVDDGELALRAVQESPDRFDLILMDYDMPNMNGITSTVEIRKWEKAESQTPCKIVALTAHAVQSYIDECMEAGMDEYLSKPIDVKKLEALLRSMFL